jgi:hypothetical protein
MMDAQVTKNSKFGIEILESITEQATAGLTMTYIEMMNDIDLSQVFLWFQEKELLGAAAFLFNKSPGLKFKPSDMIRNLVLSCFMNESIETQE